MSAALSPSLRKKLEEMAREHGRIYGDDVDTAYARRAFMAGAEAAFALMSEATSGDDERDAAKCAEPHFDSGEVTWGEIARSAFLEGRRGMVPASQVEAARKEERERIERALRVCNGFVESWGPEDVIDYIRTTPTRKESE